MAGLGPFVSVKRVDSRNGWRVRFRLVAGENPSGSKIYPTEAEAEAKAEILRAQISTSRRTVGDALTSYVDESRERGVRTAGEIDRDLKKLLGDALDLPLGALTPRRATDLYEAHARRVSGGTALLHLKRARAWGGWMAHAKRRWVKLNPFGTVEAIGAVADHRGESLRFDEAAKFRASALDLARGGDAGALAALAILLCGCRPRELVQVTARDVDADGTIVHVDGERLKTRNSRRQIEILDGDLRALLVAAATGKAPTDRVFPFAVGYVAKAAARVARVAGVPTVNALQLRRTFISLAARRGASLDVVAFSAGHGADARAATAKKFYAAPGSVEAGAQRRALGVLSGGKR